MSSPATLARLRDLMAEGKQEIPGDEDSARRQWWAALGVLQDDYLIPRPPDSGVWLAAPLPALYEPELLAALRGWVWTPSDLSDQWPGAKPMLPGGAGATGGGLRRLALRDEDGTDPVLMLFTSRIQLGLALHGEPGRRGLVIRSDPEILSAALTLLDSRLKEDDPEESTRLREALRDVGAMRSDPELAAGFWPRLSARLAGMAPSVTLQPVLTPASDDGDAARARAAELQLLEALTHEVRTPLATIRTLIRSLLRRSGLDAVVRERLQRIDAECSEQIDRFGLIFHAAELERRPPSPAALARTDLSSLLQQLSPAWAQQLQRRDLTFQLLLAPDLPPVLSDASLLETTLGGLMDRFSRSLRARQLVTLELSPAGDRLKLQLTARDPSPGPSGACAAESSQASAATVGPVLSWSPETGSLHLSQEATQRLFHNLGGRLTERSGQSMVVFFPVADEASVDRLC
ncbi:HAMP domain-containing histidine kinase [Synechococcus sp. RSCCF101]|uniref:histidine kinase dimerization/phospho-acceptor domain-containing protein n=1 Tax=Synechococcus sp. RSCCF101 TaxID=2511069 RepID=UPI0012459DE8|nr:histidine kinase dimerization/phospho-acceptor domain-containing protein [Synechococcus sp. RSCCF101]QEY32150.1 HAMP domain-containing histidine kinase [Synechococcus sp. RSCCF101]